MAQYIRFTKTTKKDVTVGKFYEVKNLDTGNGYYFDDDAGDERYVRRRGKLNYFEVFNEADFPVSEVSDDELDDAVSAIEQVQEPEDETRYIVFSDTDKNDVTLGKPYVIAKEDKGGYVFYDDVDDMRYVSMNTGDNTFEIVDEDGEPWLDAYERSCREAEDELDAVKAEIEEFLASCQRGEEPSEVPDGIVCIDFMDGYVAHFHDVDSFDIEERVGITMVVIKDVEGGITLIPFDKVRKIRLLEMTDGSDE